VSVLRRRFAGSGSAVKGVLDGIGWVLWSATIGLESPIAARVEAAQAAEFTRVSVSAPDVAQLAEQGTTPEELGRELRDCGLEIVLDPVMNWYGATPFPGPYADMSLDDELRVCEALPVVAMTAIGPFSPDEVPADDLPELFGKFCDRAADLGARVQFEFMPFSAITDLATAWGIVQAADRPNGGIMFDTWHFFRSTADFSALERLPGDRIFGVQVSDGAADVQGSLNEDTFNRLLPGDGVFDLARVVGVLDRIGGLGWVGPEVLSPVTAAMAPAEAARLAGDRVRELITRVRSDNAAGAP
jgi:sugar phosphate isomerase/epimerase